MHNFPTHLSCAATLPYNTLASKIGTLFYSSLVALKRSYDDSTEDRRIPIFLEISSTDWHVYDAPSWL